MKTQIFIPRISGCLLSILLVSSSFAQIDLKMLGPIVLTSDKAKVTEKISSNFNKFFPNAENAKCYELDKCFLIKFFMDDQEQRVLLNKNAHLIYHISYGSEKHLPVDVRKMIRSEYFDYTITRATRVKENNRTVWVVDLEDNLSFISLMVENGEMEKVKTYQKSM